MGPTTQKTPRLNRQFVTGHHPLPQPHQHTQWYESKTKQFRSNSSQPTHGCTCFFGLSSPCPAVCARRPLFRLGWTAVGLWAVGGRRLPIFFNTISGSRFALFRAPSFFFFRSFYHPGVLSFLPWARVVRFSSDVSVSIVRCQLCRRSALWAHYFGTLVISSVSWGRSPGLVIVCCVFVFSILTSPHLIWLFRRVSA